MKKNLLALLLTTLAIPAVAKDRALLIGVGKYQIKQANLPGIDLDVGMMQKTAQALGFRQIKTLQNEEATLKNVEQALSTWLTEGVGKNDRILVYFSGHGTSVPDQSGDEADQYDEALAMHDMKFVGDTPETLTLQNVLLDDRFNELLDNIPSDHIMVLLDACHSGTATRAAISKYVPKSYIWEGMDKGGNTRGIIVGEAKKAVPNRIITLSAAQDNEKSLATSEGSPFTTGLSQAVQQATANNTALTPTTLQQAVTTFLVNTIQDKVSLFHPQLSGIADLLLQPIATQAIASVTNSIFAPSPPTGLPAATLASTLNNSMAQRLTALLDKTQPLTVQMNQSQYQNGDKLTISVSVPHGGYLHIIEVNANDQATVLFPNQYHQDNQIQAGNFTLPTAQMNFDFTAGEPFGRSLVLAFLTSQPFNLYKDGKLDQIFTTVSASELPSFTRAIAPTLKQQVVLAGKAETKVCATAGSC